jgi:hypothetical protein
MGGLIFNELKQIQMAQNILLKRSGVAGKTPTTSSLSVGEVAINTYDGKVFLHKSGSAESIEQIVVTNSITTGSITLTQTGSFGEIVVTNDVNVAGGVYVTGDIVGNGDIDIAGAVSASIVSASVFIGSGAQLTGVTASMRPDDFDFNSDPYTGTVGYIQGSGSLYKVATTNDAVEFRYNEEVRGTFTTTNGFSGSLYGIGDVLSFSGSVATRLANLEASASLLDAGQF